MTFEDKLKYARTRISLSNPFFASLALHAKCGLKNGPGKTAWTDGRDIWFHPEFAQTLSREEFAGVYLHEVLHVAWLHLPRSKRGGYDPRLYNIAADFVINLVITDFAKDTYSTRGQTVIALPEDALLDERFRDMSTEQVYHILKNELPPQGSHALEGDLQVEALPTSQLKEAETTWKNRTVQAVQAAKMQGKLPAGVSREVHNLLNPKVDWRQKLKVAVQRFPADYTYQERDRRFLTSPFVIPTMHGERISIIVAVDTSASFTEDELRIALSETYGIFEAYDRIDMTVISCDADVQTVVEVINKRDLLRVKLKGGGGTNFVPVFKLIEKEYRDAEMLVYSTDGWGDYPRQPGRHKTLWVITGEYPRENIPFGEVVYY